MQKFRPEGNDPGLPVLKIKELGQGSCESDAERCRSDIDESVRIYDGDLVFSWSGTLLLDFWAGGDAGLNQHLFKVTSERYPSWFVYMWTKYHMRKFIALAKDRATTMGHIKRSALAEAEVLIPPADVLGKLTEQMQPVVDQMIGLKVEARKLGELRDVLLPKLMSGEIDVSKVDLTPLNNHFSRPACNFEKMIPSPPKKGIQMESAINNIMKRMRTVLSSSQLQRLVGVLREELNPMPKDDSELLSLFITAKNAHVR